MGDCCVIRRNYLALFLPICIVILSIGIVEIADAQQGDQQLPPIHNGQYVALVSDSGSVQMHKIFGNAIIHDKNSETDIVIDNYDIKIQQLNINNGKWSDMAINSKPCLDDDQWYHIDEITLMECYREMPQGVLLIQYSVNDGVCVTAQYQHEDKNQNQTHYFRLVETMNANFDSYDEELELITANGKVLKPTNELRLLQKANVSFDGFELITEFTTPDKLKHGYMIEFSRCFDY